MCNQDNLTRRQLSNIHLPPVVMLSELDLDVVQNPTRLSNPLLIAVRPSESIVRKCIEMMQPLPNSVAGVCINDSNDDDDDIDDLGIQVGGLGVFNRCALKIWEGASQTSAIGYEVLQELRWISNSDGILTNEECSIIEKTLLDSKPCDQVLAIGDIIVDVHDLSTLVGERYLTGFIIDIACLKYKETAKHGIYNVYLPSFFQNWASAGDAEYLKNKILQYVQPEDIVRVHWVLTPIHVAGAHWGLLCINLKTSQIFYDDGLHWNPPSNMVDNIKMVLQTLHQISGHQGKFDESKWNYSLPIQRFGMPTQPSGSGSCGMGVILSVDTIMNGPVMTIPMFLWKYDDMHKHRRILMKHFIEWKLGKI
jgi:hypothetical protein